MNMLDRREFLRMTAVGAACALGNRALAAQSVPAPAGTRPSTKRVLRASDAVTLGKTGITPSRLAIGMGSNGGEQRDRGVDGMVRLLRHAFDRGVCWWDTADLYQTHPHAAAALRQLKRDRVVITSKTLKKDAVGVRADVERFRRELSTDYIDILLLHCVSDAAWPEKMRGAMDELSEAKSKGHVRAIGCSLHVSDSRPGGLLAALAAAADERWGDVHLVRINPYAVCTDVEKPEQIPVLERAFRKMHERGKALYGMKILGGAKGPRDAEFKGERITESLRFVLSRPYISGFTIGLSRKEDIDDIIRRIERIRI